MWIQLKALCPFSKLPRVILFSPQLAPSDHDPQV